jgi:DNA ligase (NAD+)
MAEKSATNLLSQIENSKRRELRRLVFGLGIRFVGERAAGLLARRFGTLEALAAATVEEIDDIYEIGPAVAQSVHDWFADPANRRLVERLAEAGVKAETPAEAALSTALRGKQFVLTGAMEGMTRGEAKSAIEQRGGRVTSAVSKKTDYLVYGKDPGSKYEKAQELGVRCLDEPAFRDLLASE